ncbi:uncharacterized protein N7469_006177 [Penicillium citrinum]|uniref:Uncharacterized protein n=1 Tax=Penicillium citrinum TaxID=5077 RepID=A0A9W9NXF8_PENCI|nr:uncharacterized protein N7469_006177 [Penicillium citrinum]KAJ5231589.1 hypothetical protein N7469_006177 [Penicillium citrinum]
MGAQIQCHWRYSCPDRPYPSFSGVGNGQVSITVYHQRPGSCISGDNSLLMFDRNPVIEVSGEMLAAAKHTAERGTLNEMQNNNIE